MTEILLLSETVGQSAKRDALSVVAAFATIGPGWALGSAAMQWVGFLMLMVIVLAHATGARKKQTMTIAQARKKLDDLEKKEET